MVEDAELLRRYVEEGSEEAFAELVRRHLSLVYFGALRRTSGDAHLAAEVSQGVFIRLAQHARTLRRHPVLSAWLFTTTRNAAINARIAENRRQRREQEAFTMQETLAEAEPPADWEHLSPLLFETLDLLSEQERVAVLLRFFAGRAFAEIGEKLQLSEEAARKRVERALAKMHEALGRRGVTSTTTALAVAMANQANAAVPSGLAATVTHAAVAGAVVGGVATEVFTVMSTSKITGGVVGLALALGLSLVGNAYLLQQASPGASRPELSQTMAMPAATAAAAVVPMPPHEFVRNGDLATLRDQLRAAGTDEGTIHGVLEQILYMRYRQKLSDNRAESERLWWQDIQRTWGTAGSRPLGEDTALLSRMVTNEMERLVGLHPLERAAAEARYAFLPGELRQAFVALGRSEPTAAMTTGNAETDAQSRTDYETARRAFDERSQALLASLTPEQRREYDLHFSGFATGLQQQLLPATLTEQEYRVVYPLAEAYAREFGALPATEKIGEAKNQLDRRTAEQLISTFGYDRALDLIWSATPEYSTYERVVREGGLPAPTTSQVLQLAAETGDRAAAIHADAALTLEQKQASLLELQQRTQAQLDALIPPAQQQRLPADSLARITLLGQGRYKPIVTSLPGQNMRMLIAPISVNAAVPAFRPSANLVPPRASRG
jgi:RNA polymerase sigma factor (sigma-70 family)